MHNNPQTGVHWTQTASTVTTSLSSLNWNRRVCSQQIYSNCVMLSCEYESKSLFPAPYRTVKAALKAKKGVQPTTKVYLTKCQVSIFHPNLSVENTLTPPSYHFYNVAAHVFL